MLCFTFHNTTFFIVWLSRKEATTETTVFMLDVFWPWRLEWKYWGDCTTRFAWMGGCLVGQPRTQLILQWRYLKWTELALPCELGGAYSVTIVIMEMNTLWLVWHGDEWVSMWFPCSAKGGSCSLTGQCGYPGQWQRQIQSINISCDYDVTPQAPPCNGFDRFWRLPGHWSDHGKIYGLVEAMTKWFILLCVITDDVKGFPPAPLCVSLRVIWGFPSCENMTNTAGCGLDPYFLFWWFFFLFFDFWFFFDDLTLFILACFHIVENMRGLNEYARAK